ncbi:MAG TPA: DUF5302 domain-containing protein [Jiangellaceae bacterium]
MSPSGRSDDEMRRKFREALKRKKQGSPSGEDRPDDGSAKSHGKDAPPQRVFRRKSG